MESLSFAVILIILAVLRRVARNDKAQKKNTGTAAASPTGTKQWNDAVPVAIARPIPERQEKMPRPAPRRGAVPDAACVVCDNAGKDHFTHDRERRVAQLDDFLKNGIIDKAEYRKLRERYERS